MKLSVILIALALVLSGCSLSIIHPPSAAAFMEKGDGDLQKNLTVSYVKGSLGEALNPYKKVKSEPLTDDEHYYSDTEWFFQASFDVQKQIGNFKIGGGVDWLTPFLQAGFISDYFGVMGWSNLGLWQLEKCEHAYFQWGGGITIIEQLPLLSRRLRLGLTQHVSRNGREAYKYKYDEWGPGYSAPVFYDEIGAGAYVAGIVGQRLGMGLEFRYGRDLTYKVMNWENKSIDPVNRYTVMINFQWW